MNDTVSMVFEMRLFTTVFGSFCNYILNKRSFSSFSSSLDFKKTEATFLLSLLGLHLPLDLLLHDDTVLSVPIPVSNCALYTAVAGLQQDVSSQDLHSS